MYRIDLRSDTVTHPTQAMRDAMYRAEVGDDVFGEDPTVNRLQEMAAERLGMEAGLFLPSGTMGNLVAVLAHCGRGDEVILGHLAHTFLYEGGGIAALGGVHPHTVPNEVDGTIAMANLAGALRADNPHQPISRLVCLENTHNRCGGVPITAAYTAQVGEFCRENGLALHIDGARIFDAQVALGTPASELAAPADSITFCLSKGLCAPVGSVLCGSHAFIKKAIRARKMVGGGMRQAGMIAAAGIVALDSMIDRLAEDHARAKTLAQTLAQLPGVSLETDPPPGAMIYIRFDPFAPLNAEGFQAAMAKEGVTLGILGPDRMRLVVHYWVTDEVLEHVITAAQRVFAAASTRK
ncbi:MAG: low-specificity L-threonine aldolase [Anaerolineales bacterium]|nr:low-specificity L-threonine aldolase [Anaerolineales bacterium]